MGAECWTVTQFGARGRTETSLILDIVHFEVAGYKLGSHWCTEMNYATDLAEITFG